MTYRVGVAAMAVVVMLTVSPIVRAEALTGPDGEGLRFWHALRGHEVAALEDVEQHRLSARVLDRADALYRLSSEIESVGSGAACGQAARTLAFMVRGFVETSRRLEISREWSHFAPRYVDAREACLAALHVEPAHYPLPSGFAR